MLDVAHSILLIGPTGSGKSYFAHSALRSLGSGAIVLSPGRDEENSYFDLLRNPRYVFEGFDDPEYQPIIGDKVAKGYKALLNWMKKLNAGIADGSIPKPAALVVDTASAIGRLAYNQTMAKFSYDEPPAAQSPNGAAFYGYLRLAQESFWRLASSVKGQGVHLIALAHPKEVEGVSDAAVPSDVALGKKLMVDLPGAFRDALPGRFDMVFANLVESETVLKDGKEVGKRRVWRLQHVPSNRRPTKSRWGNLGKALPNTWPELMARIEKAAEERMKE